MTQPSERLIVALDVSDPQQGLDLVDQLSESVRLFKVGLQLFTAAGPSFIRQVLERGGNVFLDLKLHDIPNTVAHAALEAGRLGVHMLTLHTLGGRAALSQARQFVDTYSQKEGWTPPILLGVTILTSMNQSDLGSIGIESRLDSLVVRLASQAREAGLDGIVASPRELPSLRKAQLQDLLFVTPGIRPVQAGKDDQARTRTPSQAIADGADYLVVGRPITAAPSPVAAAQRILAEMAHAKMSPR